jgi:FixJ family two-component response regulator
MALQRSVEVAESRRVAHERLARLTARELDISLALFGGRSNKAVAHDLGISVRTVEMHRAHIMAKLGVKSIAEAAVMATHAGLSIAQRKPVLAPLGIARRGPSFEGRRLARTGS